MAKEIKIFKSMEQQEWNFLSHFANMTPGERLQALAKLQRQTFDYTQPVIKKITIRKNLKNGFGE